MVQQKKIGILGGTFNPVHNGHLLLAEQAREYCGLEKVLFIPSGNSYMKDSSEILSGETRLSMTALAIEGNPAFELSAIEVERGGFSYTYDTLRELKKIYFDTQFYFIIGADNLFTIERWKNFREILTGCTLAAAARGVKSEEQLKEKALELKHKFQAEILLLPERKLDISSTEIRKRVSRGASIRYMVPESVLHYIKENSLYEMAF